MWNVDQTIMDHSTSDERNFPSVIARSSEQAYIHPAITVLKKWQIPFLMLCVMCYVPNSIDITSMPQRPLECAQTNERKMLHFLSLQNFELCDSFTLLHHSPSAKFSACFLAFISTLYCNNIDAADAAADFSLLFILGYDRTITSI